MAWRIVALVDIETWLYAHFEARLVAIAPVQDHVIVEDDGMQKATLPMSSASAARCRFRSIGKMFASG